MKRETAKAVHQFFDQISLEIYVADRIASIHEAMEASNSLEELKSQQGQIKELKLLLKAKEYSKNILDKG